MQYDEMHCQDVLIMLEMMSLQFAQLNDTFNFFHHFCGFSNLRWLNIVTRFNRFNVVLIERFVVFVDDFYYNAECKTIKLQGG